MILWCAERVYVKGKFEKDWGVLVEPSGVIQAIGPCQQLVAKAKSVFHYPGRVLLPSFINPHHHGFHRLFRGITDFNASFQELLENLIWPLSGAVDDEFFEAAYRIAFAEQALAGVGSIGEFHYLHNGHYQRPDRSNFADKIVRIATDMGMRIALVYGFFDQGSMERGRGFIQPLDLSLDEYHRLQKKYRDHSLVSVIPGIHSLEHTSPDAIIAAFELAEKYDTKCHVQLGEREAEMESARVQYGTTPLRALEKIGVMGERMVVINGTHLDDEELALMKKHGISAVLCPSASLARGDDFPNTFGFLREGIPITVASDSVCMTGNYSVADEIKWLEFSQRSLQKTMNILCSQTEIDSLWDLGTSMAARVLDGQSAQLMPGSQADFMLVTVSQPCAKPHFNQDDHHFINQLVFGWGAQVKVTHLMVQGKMIVKNGFLDMDLSPSYQRMEQWSQAFMRSMKKSADKNGTNGGADRRQEDGVPSEPGRQ